VTYFDHGSDFGGGDGGSGGGGGGSGGVLAVEDRNARVEWICFVALTYCSSCQEPAHSGARALVAGGPRRVRAPIGESYSLGLLLGFTFLAWGFFLAASGATGVGVSLSMFGELFGGTVPGGSAFSACDG